MQSFSNYFPYALTNLVPKLQPVNHSSPTWCAGLFMVDAFDPAKLSKQPSRPLSRLHPKPNSNPKPRFTCQISSLQLRPREFLMCRTSAVVTSPSSSRKSPKLRSLYSRPLQLLPIEPTHEATTSWDLHCARLQPAPACFELHRAVSLQIVSNSSSVRHPHEQVKKKAFCPWGSFRMKWIPSSSTC